MNAISSWDYKTLGTRPVVVSTDLKGRGNAITYASTLQRSQTLGHYGYADSTQGERRAQNQLQAIAVAACPLSPNQASSDALHPAGGQDSTPPQVFLKSIN